MCRIRIATATVEHYRSQEGHREQQLEWRNPLATCPGNRERKRSLQTCDARKGRRELMLDPLDPGIATRIQYRFGDGSIVAPRGRDQQDVDDVLNLNTQVLKERRKAAFDSFLSGLQRSLPDTGPWKVEHLEAALRRLSSRGTYAEYLGMLEYWVAKRQPAAAPRK